MKRKTAIIAVRAVGTLAGLLGAYLLYSVFQMPFILGDDVPWFGLAAFTLVPAVIAVFFIWVAYLVWFRFSPLAVRQVCGVLGLFLLLLLLGSFHPENAAMALLWLLAFLSLAVIVLWGYRVLSHYLNDVIFRRST